MNKAQRLEFIKARFIGLRSKRVERELALNPVEEDEEEGTAKLTGMFAPRRRDVEEESALVRRSLEINNFFSDNDWDNFNSSEVQSKEMKRIFG